MKNDMGSNKETSGKVASDVSLPLTANQTPNVNDEWKAAAFESAADPRLVEFVKAFARWQADKDYDRLVKEGKQPWEGNDDD